VSWLQLTLFLCSLKPAKWPKTSSLFVIDQGANGYSKILYRFIQNWQDIKFNRCPLVSPLSLEGEGWGEGEKVGKSIEF